MGEGASLSKCENEQSNEYFPQIGVDITSQLAEEILDQLPDILQNTGNSANFMTK